MADSIWWTKMLHKEDFCEHFCEMSDKEIVEDIRKSIASFMKQREEGEDFGAKMVHKAKIRIDAVHDVRSDAGKQGGRPKKSPQDAPNGNAGVDMHDAGNGSASKSPTSCDTLTADGDTREDSQAKPDGSAITRNETRAHDALEPSATIYGEAATCDGAEVSTTFSKNFEARQSQRRAVADSVRGTPSHSAHARSISKNSRCPNSREEFHAFVADNNLHEALAEEWYAIHEARGWVDENGHPIKNWRGALYNYCTKTEQKRRTA